METYLLEWVGMGAIYNMDNKISFGNFFKG